MVPYIHKENRIAERCWRTLATIKHSLLIDNDLLINFLTEIIDTPNYLRNYFPIKQNSIAYIPKKPKQNKIKPRVHTNF